MSRGTSFVVAVLPLVAAGCGCDSPPKAPALSTEAVYQNDAVGLRFVTPEGWTAAAKGSVPAGALDRPIRLVSYNAEGGPGGLEVFAVDVPRGQELPAYLDQHKIGADTWVTKGAGAAVTVNGTAATRYAQTAAKKAGRSRELIAFPRGERAVVFVLTFPTGDDAVRDTARRAVETATWK